jgi:cytochrome c-type biogenesis protein CcmE
VTDLDDQLRKAVEESEATATTADVSSREPEPEPESKRNLGLLLGLLAIGGAILTFVLARPSDNMIYSKGVDQVLSTWDAQGERNLRVQGVLVHGSLLKREEPCEYRFRIRDIANSGKGDVEVRYASCIVPDTFRDVKGMDVEVTAEGQLAGGFLQAKHIFAKCPSKYEMQQRQAAGEQAPHTVTPPGAAPAADAPDSLPPVQNLADVPGTKG